MKADTEFNESIICPLCGNRADNFSVSESNLRFLRSRIQEKNVNEALNICAAAWSAFPELRNHSDTRNIVDTLIGHIEQQFSRTLIPLETIAKTTTPLNLKIEQLTERLPEDMKSEFIETNKLLINELKLIQEATKQFAEPIQKDLKELQMWIGSLVNKPSVTGRVNELTLQMGWQEAFVKDKITRIGGAGRPDIVVAPYLEFGGSRYGSKIIVERKAGIQKYCGTHFAEAIAHTKAEGAKYCMIVYDSQDNLLMLQKPVCFSVSDGITLSVSDVQTGGWRTSRQVIEVIQVTLPADDTDAAPAINLKKLQVAVQQISNLNTQIDVLRKSNNLAITNCEKTRESINKLEQFIRCYQENIQSLLLEKRPQLESGSG